jgi:hypothetical protein
MTKKPVHRREAQMGRRDFLKLAPVGAASLGVLASAHAEPSSSGIPVMGDAPQLFVDLERVGLLENVQQVFHGADKHPSNPVIRRVKPWENDRGTWGSVSFDAEEKIFKAWYGGSSDKTHDSVPPGTPTPRSVLCYATSQDGINWERPNLGLYEVMGTKENNMVVGDEHHEGMDHWESVRKDPLETNPQRRYKGLGWSSFDWDGPLSGIYTMTSPDGLHWTHTPEPIVHFHPRPGTHDLGPIGDAQALMIDTAQRRYVALLRAAPNRKMSVSTDFINWTDPRVCLKAREGQEGNTIYNHVGFNYGDRYLGFLTYFSRDPHNPLLTIRLLSSLDGDNWEQLDTGRPLIDVGEVGEWDRFTLMLTGAPPIQVGDKLYIYYRGMATRHKPYEGKDSGTAGGGIGLATLRVDGFASLNANYEGGKVTTALFITQGRELHVNAKADVGQLQAEVLDEQNFPIPGFTRNDCVPVHADSCDCAVRWRENTSLAKLQGRPIRLRFYLQNARFYSYRVVA